MQLTRTIGQLLRGKRLLIFDFDGTVADTAPLHAAAFEQVLSPLGIEVHYPSIAGMKSEDAVVYSAQNSGHVLAPDQIAELVSAKQARIRAMISSRLEPLPGMDRFLKWARQHYRLSMATSGSRGTVSLALEKLGYLNWFSPLVCADDVERAKPHPDIFLRVLQLTRFDSSQAIVFEDSEAGFRSAVDAGIPYVNVRDVDWQLELLKLGA
jgi:HAD superfamily hydrolase (TIGR01509 family)